MKWSTALFFLFLASATLLAGCSTMISGTTDSTASYEDQQMTVDIVSRLSNDTITAPYSFSISAQDGVVIIGGFVSDSHARRMALSVAAGTPGVTEVVDRMIW
ncbi:MAG: BON domain-containing protein [Verrucomicrobia bacterium]|nr:BON domain-containing protein [Verrucomicrobiota bacterium]